MEEKKKEIRTQITLDAEAISEFMMYQIYTGGAGIAVLVLGAAFLPVLLRCGLYFLAFSAAGVLASATGQRQCGQICRLFADGAGLCASVLTLYFFMVFLSTLLLLITGSGG